ncbi:MAG: hypothetical protein ACLQVF_32335 [Isosphaeraceae bacterium]
MRGDDRPSRYPPRGVWLGFILAAGMAPILLAQDSLSARDLRASKEPIVLSARRVAPWDGFGARWLYLSGDVAVLQGTEGIRAQQAVARIRTVESPEGEKVYVVDLYSEGKVQLSAAAEPRARHRATFETSHEVRVSPYQESGLARLPGSPWQYEIVRRSGLVPLPEQVATAGAPAQAPADSATKPDPPQSMAIPASAAPPYSERSTPPAVLPIEPAPAAAQPGAGGDPKLDPMVRPVQYTTTSTVRPTPDPNVVQTVAQAPGNGDRPAVDLPPIEGEPEVQVPNLSPNREDLPPSLEPLPEGAMNAPPRALPPGAPPGLPPGMVPILPGTQRITSLFPLSGRQLQVRFLPVTPDGVQTIICRGGINLVAKSPKFGTIDIEADEAVIWRGPNRVKGQPMQMPMGETWVDDDKQPMEVYLEGNVVLRQDENKWAGKGDQRTIRAPRVYYDFLTDRALAPDAEVAVYAPGLLQPIKIKSPRVEQFRRMIQLADGSFALAEQPEIRAEPAVTTGSRFPDPGYKFTNRSIDLTRYTRPASDPNSGKKLNDARDPAPDEEVVWRFDARQNVYYFGPIPVFYWPRIVADIDDLEPPLRQFFYRENNYFGQQLLTDWNGFRLLQMRRPDWVDLWNVDVDYLSARTKDFPALGSEIGWYGTDFFRDLMDPYHRNRPQADTITDSYYGYFDIWGLKDEGIDVLGTGPAIVTNGPAGAGKAGFQRSADPPFQSVRGRLNLRHNQRFLPDDEEHEFQELRVQVEAAYASDRNFIEEYYKRLFDTGQDQETLAYGIYQRDNQTVDFWSEANLQNWYTDTQWLPRVDYYRLGDSFLSNLFTYYQHSGMDYATIHTDNMVNNPNLFAFMPYDPISHTAGTFSSGRIYTNHELDMPLNLFNVIRFVPYVQGQAVGWTDQLGGGPLELSPTGAMGRVWGAAGMRAEFTAWKKYPDVESELLNIHGLNNKISLFTDARAAFSNVNLNKIAVQDDLDDNTYEYVRRYFALTNFMNGILPFPYDPRHLILRQTLSPITGTTDIQSTINTVQMGVHQRLQTKRGPAGKRRIVDYMTLDASATYFPTASRDNFGVPWGQALYNWQWFIGDRTSIVSMGWFDFWKLVGSQPLANNLTTGYNPNGLNIISTGISISRPPRANFYMGYMIIDTGPIKTSALNTSISYWLSPKWYGSFSTSYDFGDAVLLASMFSFTRIGADYLTTFGLSVDPQRGSYMFAFQITPRISPSLNLGGNGGMNTFDTRYAPTQ